VLKGTPTNPNAMATVYWDKATNDVYLLVNHMSPTPSDKQYQLWAIVNGKPVDAGVFSVSADTSGIHKMGRFENAQAFAVTVERLGGSPTPSLETMVVIGNI
jgi:anti-sigma-K factor RskA